MKLADWARQDLNASINLERMAASSAATACGGDVRPKAEVVPLDAAPTKQEPNAIEGVVLGG